MDREIKFRGKRVDNGEWVYGYFFQIPQLNLYEIFTGKLDITTGHPIRESYEVIPETVGQYIGVTDIDNEEIYEDDIVSQESNIPYSLLFIIGHINFLYGQFVITSSLGNSELNPFTTTVKILGNKFDNPELLEK